MNQNYLSTQVVTLPSQSNHHHHNFHQIVIGLQGQTEFDIEGCGSLVHPGHGCLVSCDDEHAFCGMGDNQILVLNLPDDANFSNDKLDYIEQLFDHKHNSEYFQLDSHRKQLVQALSREMQLMPNDPLLSEACGNTLLCILQHHFQQRTLVHRHRVRIDMDLIDKYIHLHLGRKISVAQLAGCVFLGESQFYALFKEVTGYTPHQYLLKTRLITAQELLQHTPQELAQIAQNCGFANQSSFTNSFSRYFNVSPAKCRKNSL